MISRTENCDGFTTTRILEQSQPETSHKLAIDFGAPFPPAEDQI